MFPWFFLFMALGTASAQDTAQIQNPGLQNLTLQNPGFEIPAANAGQIPGWQVWVEKGSESAVQVHTDGGQFKEGSRSLLIESQQPARVRVSQEFYLPVGSIWKVTAWIKAEALQPKQGDEEEDVREAGAFAVETPAGKQGKASLPPGTFEWRREALEFRFPRRGACALPCATGPQGRSGWMTST
jgi:hypothetical protein